MSGIKKILVPTDFSEASKAALKYACELATATNASVCILHAFENPYPVGACPEHCSLPQDYFEQFERSARRTLDSFVEAVVAPDEGKQHRVRLVVRRGTAAPEILRYLREHDDIDLVVMATHGRGGVARLMMGSVADTLAREAPCPVLTIRVPGGEETKTSPRRVNEAPLMRSIGNVGWPGRPDRVHRGRGIRRRADPADRGRASGSGPMRPSSSRLSMWCLSQRIMSSNLPPLSQRRRRSKIQRVVVAVRPNFSIR